MVKSWFWIILLAVNANCHPCGHDMLQHELSGTGGIPRATRGSVVVSSVNPRSASAVPLRVHLETSLLEDAGDPATCYSGDEGLLRALGTGSKGKCGTDGLVADCRLECTKDTLVTAEKREAVIKSTHEAMGTISNAIAAKFPVSGPLTLSKSQCGLASFTPAAVPPGFTAESVDIAIFLTARETFGGIVGYAVACEIDSIGRPVAAHVNINPSRIPTDGNFVSREWKSLVRTIEHEIIHSLGFDEPGLRAMKNSDGTIGPKVVSVATSSIDSLGATKKTLLLASPAVKSAVRRHTGCPSALGAELEDGGGSGTELTHFEKRVFGEELMTGSLGNFDAVLSEITLAALEDTGLYTANYSAAEPLRWIHRMGCSALSGCPEGISVCPGGLGSTLMLRTRSAETAQTQVDVAAVANSPNQRLAKKKFFGGTNVAGNNNSNNGRFLHARQESAGEGKYVCSANGMPSGCTHDGRKGEQNLVSYKSSLPREFNYYPGSDKVGSTDALGDYCPFVIPYSTGDCREQGSVTLKEIESGQVAGPKSWCFVANLDAQVGLTPSCLERYCVVKVNQTDVDLIVRINDWYHTCPRAGGSMAVGEGGKQTVHCPRPRVACLDSDIVSRSWIDPPNPTPKPGEDGAPVSIPVGPNALERPDFTGVNGSSMQFDLSLAITLAIIVALCFL